MCHAGRSGSWYSNSISAVVDNRDKTTDLDAKVIILDGTGEINPDYDPVKDDICSGRNFSRVMDNLTIHFINTRCADGWSFDWRLYCPYIQEEHA